MLIISVYAGSCEASFDEAAPQEVSTPTLSDILRTHSGLQAKEYRLRLNGLRLTLRVSALYI